MNELGTALASSSIQVTLVASTALILERIASRRGPRAGSWVAASSLLLVIVLTPLAFVPLPTLLTWQLPAMSGRSAPPALEVSSTALHEPGPTNRSRAANSASSEAVSQGEFAWKYLSRTLGVGRALGTDSIRQSQAVLPRTWCIAMLFGTAWSLIHLLVGLWGARDCRRRSVAIGDPDVLALTEDLRVALGVRRSIEVRELPGMLCSTAAAVGWRRPIVILPDDWRRWNALERRAVLAHEVAHIARADYAVGVAARLGLALHFYHPLVRWLVGRLQLQQELAADAEGARLAGGHRAYRLILTRLALGMERNRPAWPATTFLPLKGHLIRRIHVLKERVPMKDTSLPATARAITIALLVAIGLGAAALRSPSPVRGAEAPPGTDKNAPNTVTSVANTSNEESFDLSYLRSKAIGFVVFRPAAIFRLPASKPQLHWLNGLIVKEFPVGMPKIESIEQAAFEFSVRPRDRSKKQQGRIMMGACMLRTVEDFDWKTAMKALFKRLDKTNLELVEVHHNGKVYFKSTRSQYPRPLGPDSFYLPDARTIVWDYENNLRQLIGQPTRTGPEFVAGDDWRKVNSGLVGVAIDTRDQRFKLDVNTDAPEDLPIAPLLQYPSRWVLGVDSANSLTLRAIATCGTNANRELLARTAEALLAQWRVSLGQVKRNASKDEQEEIAAGAIRLAHEFVQVSTIHADGLAVDIRATSHSGADALIKLILAGAF
jgi:hypothetical protein